VGRFTDHGKIGEKVTGHRVGGFRQLNIDERFCDKDVRNGMQN
jgi:hypothetical protein